MRESLREQSFREGNLIRRTNVAAHKTGSLKIHVEFSGCCTSEEQCETDDKNFKTLRSVHIGGAPFAKRTFFAVLCYI